MLYLFFGNQIVISSNNKSMNTMLYLNKTQKTKTIFELVNLGPYELNKEAAYLQRMINYILRTNSITINSSFIKDRSACTKILLNLQ